MNLTSTAISVADWVAVRSRMTHIVQPHYSGCGSALTFHSICSHPRERLYDENCFSYQALMELLQQFSRAGVSVVSVEEALRRLREYDKRYFVVLTFDDGYRDTYTQVWPALRRLNIPFTIFVCTSFVNRTNDYWWGALLALFQFQDVVDIDAMGKRFILRNQRDREVGVRQVMHWVKEDLAIRSKSLMPSFNRYDISPEALLDRDALSEDEIRSMAESSVVTIGGHGTTHLPLATLPAEQARREVADNRTFLQTISQQEVAHFAYPFGDSSACTWAEADLVRKAGYKSAFTTRIGNIFPEHLNAPFMLPRNSVHPRRPGAFHAVAQLAGVHRFLQGRGGSPVHPDTVPPI